MKKYAAYCLVMTIVCLSCPLQGQQVGITIDHPDQVRAGQEFTVTVTINKGNLTDYSRFSQDLPAGLTAMNVNSPNADFSFDNQRIRIIWLKLPETDQVKVSYSILTNERLKGSFTLGGVFAYVVEDERKFLTLDQGREIRIIPSSTIDPAYIVDIRNFEGGAEVETETGTVQGDFAMAIRQKPVLLGSGGYRVHLLIRNPPGSKYAKIEETIPSGYLFEEEESRGGIVSYAASTVKFIWMKLPESPEFEISYRLVPKQDEPQGYMAIDGLFTYTSGNENVEVGVKQLDVSIQDLSPTQKRNLLLTGNIPRGARTSTQTDQQTSGGTTTPGNTETGTTTSTTTRPAGASGNMIMDTRVLAAGTGVYFRVQIAATQTAVDASALFRQEGLQEEVLVEMHEGMYKYTTGSFQSYNLAVTFRNRVELLPSVEGSFIVAYRDGRRIPVTSVIQ